MKLARALTCELLGTAFLLATVVGSGILAHKLDNGLIAVTVLSVAFSTGCVLFALIATFGEISCHLNPAVTLSSAIRKEFPWRHAGPYIATQIVGAILGVVVANLMFELPALSWSETARTGWGQWLGEFVATFGLLAVIFGAGKHRPESAPQAIAAYVAGAIWFTSSTCFANPAVTIARIFTGTITGIRATDVPGFVLAQLAAAALACVVFSWLFGRADDDSEKGECVEAEKNGRAQVEADRAHQNRELVSTRR